MSVVTALSIEHFKQNMSTSVFPPDPKRHFVVSHLTPFGTRLETEVLGCASANPDLKSKASTTYTIGQNGYNPKTAPHKFIRMRWSVDLSIRPIKRTTDVFAGTMGYCLSVPFLEISVLEAMVSAHFRASLKVRQMPRPSQTINTE